MPPAEGALLEARGLERSFGPLRALAGVDLTVAGGEVLAVLGPNGAGKTTLLRVLAGLTRPSAGQVRVSGRALYSGDSEARRPIGFLTHQSLLYEDLTLLENLTFTARLYGLPDPSTQAALALEQMDLLGRAGDRLRYLSRGLQQRAAIARAVMHRPSVLLLDEPFTGLDAPAAERFRSLLRGHRDQGGAVVLVTHQVAEAWDLVTAVGVLAGGRWLSRQDRPSDLPAFLAHYQEVVHG